MGMPAKRVLLTSFEKTYLERCRRPRELRHEYLQEARMIKKLLTEAYARP
jgi:hypothetical protein